MKQIYTFFLMLLLVVFSYAQGYEFGLVHQGGYDFKVVAIPDFDSSGNTDISDVGFTLLLPAGNADIIFWNSLLSGRTWSVNQFEASFLTSQGLGDGTKDAFLFNVPPGQTLLAHTAGQQIDLISFTVDNTPTSGEITFLLNSDPIATGAGGVLDSFFNSNIDNTSTQDYFAGIASGLGSFSFNTLSVNEIEDSVEVAMYPNPVSKFLNIRSTISIDSVSVFDILGKAQIVTKNANRIDVSNLSSGMYLVKLETAQGTLTKRVLVK